ncbi:MAG: metallophosphoesterase [Phycisphaerae bacterium]
MTPPATHNTAPPGPTPAKRPPWLQFVKIKAFWPVRHRLSLPGLPAAFEGLRLLHLSDLHFHRRWFPAHDALLADLARDPPDLICITGDFVEDKYDHRPALPLLRRFCTGLSSRLGTFAILGNHDGDLLRTRLHGCGLHLLESENAIIRPENAQNAELELLGLPGVDRADVDPAALPAKHPARPRIVLAHFPDLVHLPGLAADVYLAGHTHGGQLCLPSGRPLLTHDSLPKTMCRGVHRIDQTWLVVSRGMGFSKWPVRTFCPAEVIELTLTADPTPDPTPP